MRLLVGRAVACLAASAIAGCAGGRPGGGPAPSAPIVIAVSNDGDFEADIYADGSGGRYHLGLVPTGVTAKLYLPSYIVGSGTLRLFVRRVGAPEWWTPAVKVQPGDSAALQLTSPVDASTLTVGPAG
jgi:hypothetical protein